MALQLNVRHMLRLLAIFLCLLCGHAAAFRADQYAFSVSAASDQLLQRTVTKIFQDRNDFLWILTQEGLHRYDGYDVVSFRTSRTVEGSISHQLTTDIVETSDGRIWVSTLGGGLNSLDRASLTFSPIRARASISNSHPLSDYISTLYMSSTGAIWIGYADGSGFSEFDPSSETFRHFFLPNTQPNASVQAFLEIGDDRVLVAVDGLGLLELNLLEDELVRFEPQSSASQRSDLLEPTQLKLLADGRVVITTYQGGAFIYDPDTGVLAPHPLHDAAAEPINLEIYAFLEDREGAHWFGTSGGIAIVSPSGETTWLTSFSTDLPNDQILEIYQSRSGTVWVGTFNGLAQGTRTLFQTFSETDGLGSNNVNTISELVNGNWAIGTERGISIMSTRRDGDAEWRVESVITDLLEDYTVMSLARDGDYLWAGTLRSGLFRINTLSEEVHQFAHDPSNPNSITNNGITSIQPYGADRILVGTYGGGLNVLNKRSGDFSSHNHRPGDAQSLSDDRVIAITVDSQNAVWVGTQNGLNRFLPDSPSFESYSYDPGDASTISSAVVLSIIEDQERNLWIGTRSGGLNVWRNRYRNTGSPIFEQYDLGGELPSSDIYGIIEGSNGYLWITHNAGLSRIDSTTNIVINFDESNGLQGPEFNHGAAFKTGDGNLLFGGPFGFNIIDPLQDFTDSFDPKINLISIKERNEQVFYSQPYVDLRAIEVNNDYQFLSIEFAALDLRRPETTQYRYRIFGLQDDWIDLGATRQVTISGVPHGNYRLAIQGTNASGLWSSNQLNLSIEIEPPLWLTWYAYLIYLLLVAGLVIYAWKRQQNKAKEESHRRKELEDRVAERTADLQGARLEAEQAAKAKSDFLAAMSHEIRTPMHGMLGMTELLLQSELTAQQVPLARAARSSGKALLELVDSILDYSRAEASKLELHSESFSLTSLVDEVCYLLAGKARTNGTIIGVVWDETPPTMLEGDAGKLRQILTNLLGNAIKFTADGEVSVLCACDTTDRSSNGEISVSIIVTDTGIGISDNKLESIFDVFTQADTSTTREYGGTGLGLAISKQLVELMGGEISVQSRVGKGSEFTVRLRLIVESDDGPQDIKSKVPIAYVGPIDLIWKSFSSKARIAGYETIAYRSLAAATVSKSAIFLHPKFLVGHDTESEQSALEKPVCFLLPYAPATSEAPALFIAAPFAVDEISAVVGRSTGDPVEAALVTPEAITSTNSAEWPSGGYLSSINALVVEDVQLNQQIACSMLANLCQSIDVAANGKDAVDAYIKKTYDAIFMDCQMPVMDGFEATAAIRAYEVEAGLPATLIVALTAATESNERERARDAGMDDFIRKPFSTDELRNALSALNGAQQHTATLIASPHSDKDSDETKFRMGSALIDGTPVIDMDVFRNLMALGSPKDSNLISQLRSGYVDQLEEKLDELCAERIEFESTEVPKIAHAIKSMSANIGALQVRKLAESIERRPDLITTPKLKEAVVRLRHLAQVFEQAFDEQLRS